MEITTTTITWCGQGVGVYISLAACPSLLISLPTLFATLKYGKSTHWNLFILHVKSDFIHYNRPRICRNRISFKSQRVTRSCRRRRVQLQRTNTTDLLHFLTTNLHEPVFSVVHIHKPPSPSSTFSYAINYCLVCSLFSLGHSLCIHMYITKVQYLVPGFPQAPSTALPPWRRRREVDLCKTGSSFNMWIVLLCRFQEATGNLTNCSS